MKKSEDIRGVQRDEAFHVESMTEEFISTVVAPIQGRFYPKSSKLREKR